jgi:hypothetical protein
MVRSYFERSRRATISLAIAAAATIAGCSGGGKGKGASSGGAGDKTPDAGLIKVKTTGLAWVFETVDGSDPIKTRVLIAQSDETGATDHTEIGSFIGSCKDETAAKKDAEVIIAAVCKDAAGERGIRLRVVHRRSEIIVLRGYLDDTGDGLSFDVIKRIKVPIGAVVKPAPQ